MVLPARPLAGIAARLRRPALDRALSDGTSPAQTPLLAARAAQLTDRHARAVIARGLEQLAAAADAPRRPTRVSPSRVAARANRAALLELAGLLRGDRCLYAQGIARLELVLIDGTGPAYTDHRGEGLARELELARTSLLR